MSHYSNVKLQIPTFPYHLSISTIYIELSLQQELSSLRFLSVQITNPLILCFRKILIRQALSYTYATL